MTPNATSPRGVEAETERAEKHENAVDAALEQLFRPRVVARTAKAMEVDNGRDLVINKESEPADEGYRHGSLLDRLGEPGRMKVKPVCPESLSGGSGAPCRT
jgi:hypothetical protein